MDGVCGQLSEVKHLGLCLPRISSQDCTDTVVRARLSIMDAELKEETQLSFTLLLRYQCLNSKCGVLLQGVHAAEDHGRSL